jgi:hypothetical protein
MLIRRIAAATLLGAIAIAHSVKSRRSRYRKASRALQRPECALRWQSRDAER